MKITLPFVRSSSRSRSGTTVVAGSSTPAPTRSTTTAKPTGRLSSGLVRVFDEKLDAKTFLYTRGESRNVVPGRPPIDPGMPRFLGGASFEVKPVALPAASSYPGLRTFIRNDEAGAEDTAIAKAEAEVAKAEPLARAAEQTLAKREPNAPPATRGRSPTRYWGSSPSPKACPSP